MNIKLIYVLLAGIVLKVLYLPKLSNVQEVLTRIKLANLYVKRVQLVVTATKLQSSQ